MAGPQNDKVVPLQSRGALIMQVAELMRPVLMEKLMHCRDENGMPVQPARVRAAALIMAQEWVKHHQSQANG